jgi:hypothetical protein
LMLSTACHSLAPPPRISNRNCRCD